MRLTLRPTAALVLALVAVSCADDRALAPEHRIAQATRAQWAVLCECEQKLCEVVERAAVFECVEDVFALHRSELGSALECLADEMERMARCYEVGGCDDDAVNACIARTRSDAANLDDVCGVQTSYAMQQELAACQHPE